MLVAWVVSSPCDLLALGYPPIVGIEGIWNRISFESASGNGRFSTLAWLLEMMIGRSCRCAGDATVRTQLSSSRQSGYPAHSSYRDWSSCCDLYGTVLGRRLGRLRLFAASSSSRRN